MATSIYTFLRKKFTLVNLITSNPHHSATRNAARRRARIPGTCS